MRLPCVHIVQYVGVECRVVWKFIEEDVFNSSDLISEKEIFRINRFLPQ